MGFGSALRAVTPPLASPLGAHRARWWDRNQAFVKPPALTGDQTTMSSSQRRQAKIRAGDSGVQPPRSGTDRYSVTTADEAVRQSLRKGRSIAHEVALMVFFTGSSPKEGHLARYAHRELSNLR